MQIRIRVGTWIQTIHMAVYRSHHQRVNTYRIETVASECFRSLWVSGVCVYTNAHMRRGNDMLIVKPCRTAT